MSRRDEMARRFWASARERLPCIVLVLLTVVACAEDDLEVRDYDQTCYDVFECIPVLSGDPCDCDAPCGAINRSDEGKYRADSQAIPGCGFSVAPSCEGLGPAERCASMDVACDGGLCTIVPSMNVACEDGLCNVVPSMTPP